MTTPRILTLRLPMPSEGLWPNDSVHWGTKTKAATRYGMAVKGEARAAWGGQPPMQRATIALRYEFCRERRRDDDNCIAAFKHGRDSLIHAGVIANDSPVALSIGSVEVVRHRHRPGQRCLGSAVLCTITEAL